MFLKIALTIVVLSTCYAADHAYSSQSIVFYKTDDHKNEKHVEAGAPAHIAIAPVYTKIDPKAYDVVTEEHNHKEEVAKPIHKIGAPVVAKEAPKVEVAKKEHNHKKLAFSSQSIHRHDVPAKPPADWIIEHGPIKYEFDYKVEDPHTGDKKSHHEARDGHTVKGVYSLHEADGSIRTVEYAADKHTGFSADVKHIGKPVEDHKHH